MKKLAGNIPAVSANESIGLSRLLLSGPPAQEHAGEDRQVDGGFCCGKAIVPQSGFSRLRTLC